MTSLDAVVIEGGKLGCPDGYTLENEYFEPQNGGLEDDFPFQLADFSVPC